MGKGTARHLAVNSRTQTEGHWSCKMTWRETRSNASYSSLAVRSSFAMKYIKSMEPQYFSWRMIIHRNACYSQSKYGGARNVWYSQSNPSGFGSGIDWEEPPSRKGILVLPLISCKINHDFDYDCHKLGPGIDNRNYWIDILKQKVAETWILRLNMDGQLCSTAHWRQMSTLGQSEVKACMDAIKKQFA